MKIPLKIVSKTALNNRTKKRTIRTLRIHYPYFNTPPQTSYRQHRQTFVAMATDQRSVRPVDFGHGLFDQSGPQLQPSTTCASIKRGKKAVCVSSAMHRRTSTRSVEHVVECNIVDIVFKYCCTRRTPTGIGNAPRCIDGQHRIDRHHRPIPILAQPDLIHAVR